MKEPLDLIYQLTEKSLNDKLVNKYFKRIFTSLRKNIERSAREKGYDLYSELYQTIDLHYYFEKVSEAKYVSEYNLLRTFVVSLKTKAANGGLTIFFNHSEDNYHVVYDKICVYHGFIGSAIGQDIWVLESHDLDKRQYLYNSNGEYLGIMGEKIECTENSFIATGINNFVIVLNNGKYTIYTENLEEILSEVEKFKVVDNAFCLALQNQKYFLCHRTKGLVIPHGLCDIQYYQDQYHYHTELEYFVLRDSKNKYGLFMVKGWVLAINFNWDNVKAHKKYDYLFYEKEKKWFKLNLHDFSSKEVESTQFKESERIIP